MSSSSWDRAARVYDRQLGLERAALATAVALAAVTADERVLDLATGTAALLGMLAVRPDRPRRAVGVDSSSAMLAAAGQLPRGWSLVRADATALPFDDDEFDVVTACYLLHLLAARDRRTVLAEAARVLRGGGRLVVVTVAPARGGLLSPMLRGLSALASRRSGILSGMRTLDPRCELIDAGFGIRAARRTTRGYPSLVVLADKR